MRSEVVQLEPRVIQRRVDDARTSYLRDRSRTTTPGLVGDSLEIKRGTPTTNRRTLGKLTDQGEIMILVSFKMLTTDWLD